LKYNPALDGLRAVAAFAVIAYHCKLPMAWGGSYGVDVFFVLSGFLITSIIVQAQRANGSFDFAGFLGKRIVRLVPALFAMLLVVMAVQQLFLGHTEYQGAAYSAAYLMDYVAATGFAEKTFGHTWSLAVEMKFYLFWPFVAVWLAGKRDRAAVLILAAVFMVLWGWRVADMLMFEDTTRTYFRFDDRLTGLVLGALISFVDWRPGRALVIGCAIALAVQLSINSSVTVAMILGVTIVEVTTAVLILHLLAEQSAISRALSARPVVYLGTISYGIYLWQSPWELALHDYFDPLPLAIVVSIASVAAAALSWHYLERPLTQWWRARPAATAA